MEKKIYSTHNIEEIEFIDEEIYQTLYSNISKDDTKSPAAGYKLRSISTLIKVSKGKKKDRQKGYKYVQKSYI